MELGEVDELVKIFEGEEVTDFARVGEVWDRMRRNMERDRNFRKNVMESLGRPLQTKLQKIKEGKLKFLEDSSLVLATSMVIAGCSILNGLKRSQIRKILDMMRNIRKSVGGDIRRDVAKVRYMLAYTSGRNQSVKILMSALDPLLAEIKTSEDFEKVYEFFQSILAFHYYLGGGE